MADFEENIREVVRDELRKMIARPDDEYLSTKDAARLAKVAIGTVRRWIAQGSLREHRAGRVIRVSRADLERWLRTHRPADDSSTPEQLAKRSYG